MADPDEMLVGVVDLKLRRPACVLLQAVMGGDIRVAHMFPAEHWLLAPTPDMARVKAPRSDWERLRYLLVAEGER